MRVTLKLPDGSEETRDVAQLTAWLGNWPVEVIPHETRPAEVFVYAPAQDDRYGFFIIRPSAANSFSVEVTEGGERESDGPSAG